MPSQGLLGSPADLIGFKRDALILLSDCIRLSSLLARALAPDLRRNTGFLLQKQPSQHVADAYGRLKMVVALGSSKTGPQIHWNDWAGHPDSFYLSDDCRLYQGFDVKNSNFAKAAYVCILNSLQNCTDGLTPQHLPTLASELWPQLLKAPEQKQPAQLRCQAGSSAAGL